MLHGVSFRQPGFANSLILRIGLLILFALAAFAAALYLLIGQPTVDRLARSQMERAAEQLEVRFGRLLKTVEITLRTSQGWGKAGDLDHDQLLRFNEFFFPIIANHGEITSVIFAHESGREILLLMTDDGRWINRISDPADRGRQTYWITWNARRQIESVEMRERDYDARERPWFKGAMALPDDRSVFWTEPYIFFTTKEPGITAVMRWQGSDGSHYVIGHDVRLIDMAEFTSHLEFSPQGKAALFLKEGRLIAPPRDPRFTHRQAINDALLKTPEDLGLPELARAFQAWQDNPAPEHGLHDHTLDDGRWLSLFKPIKGNTSGIWLGIVAPERDFVPISSNDLLLLGLISLSALALGLIVAIRIARRFGEPLMALAEESARIGAQDLDTPVSCDATWQEVSRLASALDGMRQHLRQARNDIQQANANLELTVARRTQALRESQDILQKREAFFRAIFDNAAVGIVSVDPQRRAVLINPAFARFIDQPIDRLLAHPERIALPTELLTRIDDLLPGEGSGSVPTHSLRQEIQFGEAPEAGRWGDVQIAPVFGPDGSLDSILITVLDVSERRHIEAELIRQFAFLQELLDTIPNPIFYKGADSRFLGCNAAYERFFGIRRHDLAGKRVLDLDYLPMAARLAYQAEDERIIAECGRASRDMPMPDADGHWHDTLYSVTGFRAPDDTPGGLIGVIVDISALKEAEREAERARRAAESAAAAKADFLANMSHEIRTPMNAIVGMTHLALQTELTPRQRNYLAKVDNAAKSLLGIINDILDLSKIEAGMMRFEQAPFSLDTAFRHLSDLCGVKARERGLELIYDIAPEVPDQLLGDSLRLGQVLLNLVGNAIKFTEAGEIRVAVKCLTRSESQVELGFEVIDSGIGMDAEQIDKLFSAFTQADTSTTRKYGGTGLGLSICKRIVDLQGGEIGVTSQPGVGSRFTFRLPFGLPSEQALTPQHIGLPEPLHALVVDDSPGAAEVFLHMLTLLGIDAKAVGSGEAALRELADNARYGLLIIDWKMPGMDGVSLLRRIRQEHPGHAAAVVMATANDPDELHSALGNLPVGAILAKPATPSSLFDSIMLALHREQGRRLTPSPAGNRPAARFTGQRVLLVEDNEVNRELAEEMLTSIGLTVDCAADGEQAVARVRQSAYDLVLMDCQMPVMDGYAATGLIRADPALAGLPIVAMTANALAPHRQRCLDAGMNDHIPKPIDVSVLHATLARWLGTPPDIPAPRPAEERTTLAGTAAIDAGEALARFAGNRAMYGRLLSRFCTNQADAAEQLLADHRRQDRAAMILRAHTLRGLAGNIGAAALARLAGELEALLKQEPAAQETTIARHLAELQGCLPDVVAQAENLAAEMSTPPPTVPGTMSNEALSDLHRLLDNADASAVRRFEEMSGQLTQVFGPHPVDQLARHIGQYDFDEAKELLEQMIAQRQPT